MNFLFEIWFLVFLTTYCEAEYHTVFVIKATQITPNHDTNTNFYMQYIQTTYDPHKKYKFTQYLGRKLLTTKSDPSEPNYYNLPAKFQTLNFFPSEIREIFTYNRHLESWITGGGNWKGATRVNLDCDQKTCEIYIPGLSVNQRIRKVTDKDCRIFYNNFNESDYNNFNAQYPTVTNSNRCDLSLDSDIPRCPQYVFAPCEYSVGSETPLKVGSHGFLENQVIVANGDIYAINKSNGKIKRLGLVLTTEKFSKDGHLWEWQDVTMTSANEAIKISPLWVCNEHDKNLGKPDVNSLNAGKGKKDDKERETFLERELFDKINRTKHIFCMDKNSTVYWISVEKNAWVVKDYRRLAGKITTEPIIYQRNESLELSVILNASPKWTNGEVKSLRFGDKNDTICNPAAKVFVRPIEKANFEGKDLEIQVCQVYSNCSGLKSFCKVETIPNLIFHKQGLSNSELIYENTAEHIMDLGPFMHGVDDNGSFTFLNNDKENNDDDAVVKRITMLMAKKNSDKFKNPVDFKLLSNSEVDCLIGETCSFLSWFRSKPEKTIKTDLIEWYLIYEDTSLIEILAFVVVTILFLYLLGVLIGKIYILYQMRAHSDIKNLMVKKEERSNRNYSKKEKEDDPKHFLYESVNENLIHENSQESSHTIESWSVKNM